MTSVLPCYPATASSKCLHPLSASTQLSSGLCGCWQMLLATTWTLTLHLIRAATRVSCVQAIAVSLTQNKGQILPMLPGPPPPTQPLCWLPQGLSRTRHLCPAHTGHARLRALCQLFSQSRSLCPHTCAYFLLTFSRSWYESSPHSRSLPRFPRV